MVALSPDILKFIVNHVVLPPQLPQKAEDSQLTRDAERGLIGLLSTQLEEFRRQVCHRPSKVFEAWASIEVMLGHCALLISSHALAADVLVRAFQSLHTAVNPSAILIYLRAQNAVLILRGSDKVVVFECFEASPQTVAVMATKGALTRHFPTRAVSIPLNVFHDQNFQHELADKLSKLDIEEIEEMMPQSHKAGVWGEIRDTTHPGLVTEMLMAILASLGKPVVCHQILKRTRDDVLWHACLLPWRRSALWLALRVALHTTLVGALGTEKGTSEYKNFMVFFITEIASRTSTTNLPNDLCHTVVAKVARRTSKLGSDVLKFVQDRALNVCRTMNSKQKRTWEAICDQDGKRPFTVDRSKFESDTRLTLDTIRPYLDLFLGNDQGMIQAPSSFSPKCHLWLDLHSGLPSLDGLGTVQDEDVYTLADFEDWVSNCLPVWRQQRLVALDPEDCMALVRLGTKYRDAALVAYHGAPEQISTMVLVIAELWYTLDEMASTLCPLLLQYSPEIPTTFFHPLLLPKKAQMQRLLELELHIATRRTQAAPINPSMFSDPVERSFAVQFYIWSTHHQALRVRIERDADGKRAQKEAEWRASSDRFKRLKEDAKGLNCLCDDDDDDDDDAPVCQKCANNRQAAAMTIDVYEWPLPDSENACISALFELDCPTEVAAWRNMTWILIHDLGRKAPVQGDNPAAQLPTYAGLSLYAQPRQSRLLLASKVKPFAKSHYVVKRFPVTLDRCYAKNALHYKLFDSTESCWTSDQVEDPSIHAICITPLPTGPYLNLQYAVDSVSHSQNEVIADQETCSKALSLQEYLSFGSLRADGERVQWQNIKRELAASNLSLNTEAVCTLITQAAWQAGSSGSSDLRNAHFDLENPSFCFELLTTIGTILDSIAANWNNNNVMLLSITVVLRLLSLSPDTNVDSVAIDLLQKMRIVIGQWIDTLSSVLHKAVEPTQVLKLQQRLLKAAILCKMTFDVDTQYLHRVMSTADDLKIWAKSSMHMRDNLPGKETMLPSDLRRLVLRDKKVSHALHRVVRKLVIDDKCNGLELAIAQQRSGFQPPLSSWTTFESPNDRWLFTRTASSSDRRSQELHYNMLEGELLVDGKPLGRLPMNYIQDTLYLRLFGAQILHVFPSDMDGMIYMSAQKVNGYLVHFGKREEKLVIRVRQESQVLELVPQQNFVHDLPSALREDYFHWLDIASLEIEFRPFDHRWEPNSDNWRLHYRDGSTSTLVRRDQNLIDIRSRTCVNIMRIFGALETVENICMTLSSSQCLEVALPRYDLHFFLNHDGHFECHELCKVVDPDQSVGTLIGLKSRLVLSGIQKLARKHDRILLIPDGEVLTSRTECHVEVSISVKGPHIPLLQYPIDATLRCLRGGSDTYETLYKAYLHANTSHMLPDPFTERTGTEEALVYLRQRSLDFHKPPDAKTANLLTRISLLTPRREYYPEHLKVMHQVSWDPILSMMVQHDSFLPLAERIITSANSYSVFYPECQPTESLYQRRERHLLERGMIRNSCFRSSDFGGDIDARDHDLKYETRECPAGATRVQNCFEIASLVRDWPKKLEVSEDLSRDLRSLGKISGFQTQYDPSESLFELLKVEFASSWAPLQELCRKMSPTLDKYRLLFLFSIIAYGRRSPSLKTLRTLLAFAFIPELQKIPVPGDHSYIDLIQGRWLDTYLLRRIIMDNMRKYNGGGRRKHAENWNSESRKHEAKSEEQAETVLRCYKAQWPTAHPATPSETVSTHLNWSEVRRRISALFYVWTANEKYWTYLNQIQPILDVAYEKLHQPSYNSRDWDLSAKRQVTYSHRVIPSLAKLMSRVTPAFFLKPKVLKIERNATSTRKNEKLEELIAAIRSDSKGRDRSIRTQYRKDLLASYNAFRGYKEQITPQGLPHSLTATLMHHVDCESDVNKILQCIHECLEGKNPRETLLELAGFWPRITVRTLLSQLSSRPFVTPIPAWKDCLLTLGESITTIQRARRLLLAGERNDISTFCAEIENEGHQGWRTNQQPDWLLIEIEGDFLIRPSQARVAFEMIQPSSSESSLVQLNMGEGKSSVIVPLVAVAVANGQCLSRIIVLKPLSKQMSNTISQRLGGMVDRQIYFMPFSRKLQVDERVITQIKQLNESCLESGGVLLAQPEHILSFKLMGIERLTSGDFATAAPLLTLQRWLDINTRDILDESDELLDVKFQLIYTLGSQRMMDGQPDRWLITQGIFDLVEKHVWNLQNECPSQIEVVYRTDSSFPTIRLLSREISQELINRIAHDVVGSQLSSLNFGKFTPSVKNAVLDFIQNRQVKDEDCEEFYTILGQQESFAQKLLLVRGFLAYNILLFVLRSKRWSVNYGLHPARCLSAVPYRAKGVPAPSAEFGHPDVAIALTCMSYYYTGLSNSQIRKAFELLHKSDDPTLEYSSWIKRCSELPTELRSWRAVNLEDDQQCYDKLFPALRYSKKIADFFMSNVVFPKEGKEFDEKLTTSGWDIAKKKPHVVTGFSGTNDNRFLLPLSISQRDLPVLQHTSGKVLDDVLQKDNLLYHCARDILGRQLSAEGLITFLNRLDPSICILIDVGAQILEISNQDLVKAWMDTASDVDAGIFFDEDDNIMVVTKDSKLEKLSVSSFQSRMDRCVVYLDEVHTRGTDLKLPVTARAAVTLGPRLTKDRLVQACMRLRKLAHGQTLMFLAPPEVHQNIMDLTGKSEGQLDGYDVVEWALEQSCQNIERCQPLRILQGLNHNQREVTMDRFSETYKDLDDLLKETDHSSQLVTAFREKEEQRLNDLYAPPPLKTNVVPGIIESSQDIPNRRKIVQTLLEMWKDLDSTESEGASMHEEHEREVAHEVEQETQVERPPKVKALRRAVDPDLAAFVTTGRLVKLSRFPTAYERVVKQTSVISHGISDFWTRLLVTRDFARTVQRPQLGYYDSYLRPVNWVLTSKQQNKPTSLLIISQYEANELLRDIQAPYSGVNLHIYEPRVTKSMGSVDSGLDPESRSMKLWSDLDSGLRRGLHLFSGQVYSNTYEDHSKLHEDLALDLSPSADQTLSFIQAWIAIRRKGQDFLQTHIGQMVSGRSIKEEAFE